jgi:uncharacterized small protein (DUF1192 family)
MQITYYSFCHLLIDVNFKSVSHQIKWVGVVGWLGGWVGVLFLFSELKRILLEKEIDMKQQSEHFSRLQREHKEELAKNSILQKQLQQSEKRFQFSLCGHYTTSYVRKRKTNSSVVDESLLFSLSELEKNVEELSQENQRLKTELKTHKSNQNVNTDTNTTGNESATQQQKVRCHCDVLMSEFNLNPSITFYLLFVVAFSRIPNWQNISNDFNEGAVKLFVPCEVVLEVVVAVMAVEVTPVSKASFISGKRCVLRLYMYIWSMLMILI